MVDLTINWERSILVDSYIDDELIKKLAPQILLLRQRSHEPITVGIDSRGGSLAAVDILLGLLTGPDQDGVKGKVITVSTNRAYSAAANLLAFGDYSVALPHSQVLFHDVRYGGMEDVTPDKARDAARSLQDANDAFALRLANQVINRLMWNYIDLLPKFKEIQSKYPKTYKKYVDCVSAYAPMLEPSIGIDLASFVTALWAKLSSENDKAIANVMNQLERWINLTRIANTTPAYRAKGSRIPGLLDGIKHIYGKSVAGKLEHFESAEEGLKLLLSLVAAHISTTSSGKVNFPSVLDRSVSEFRILNSMNDSKNVGSALNIMRTNAHIFFGAEFIKDFDRKSDPEKEEIYNKVVPHARLFWHFCVLLCRELFDGEHVLSPSDSQLLGLVDEIAGGGPIESRRDFRVARAKEESGKEVITGDDSKSATGISREGEVSVPPAESS